MDFKLNLNADTVQESTSATPPVLVEPRTTLREVLELMKQHRTGNVLVIRGGKLAGIYTERDALKLMANGGELDVPVEQVMVANPVTVSSSDSIATAVKKMSKGGYRRLPIVDPQGQALGAVKAPNILRYLVEHFPQTIYNLPPAPNAATQEREGA